jgi:hypothetical protein
LSGVEGEEEEEEEDWWLLDQVATSSHLVKITYFVSRCNVWEVLELELACCRVLMNWNSSWLAERWH